MCLGLALFHLCNYEIVFYLYKENGLGLGEGALLFV